MTNLPEPVRPSGASHLRASDADRERIVKVLGEALADGRLDVNEHSERLDAVYEAKTMGELEPITYDLAATPGHPQPRPADRSANTPVVDPAGASESVDQMIAIFGGVERKGRWRLRRRSRAVAVFGGVDLDLSEATFDAPEVVIELFALFGGVDVSLPEGVVIRNEASGIMGGISVKTGDAPPSPDAPVVVIKGVAIFGGADFHPKKRKWFG
ncbi:Cell wall-active antibiotics response 4TMS YvqF [Actinopolymorpha cephalotaxi]|uniref:Cell wall-active antibiotics response 4TMS YvqF n=1 Tax=Actinopolymorpha cephalotaxi TaxID=504797 RepID=A0A1I2XSF2_9ACTN|nr:DUF1707 domain-containing protein [Actinopolymorpha cephalotaxi]NYH87162.1 hypothetical protein [Actinopolymorpha cephalotaxi]SFH16394.1 Cell wall-active antibiotics response 4TMS YvqF [Actinopolymorpha cephalotaxi]